MSFMFFVESYGDHRDLHSFPTRRSSDLFRNEPYTDFSSPAIRPSMEQARDLVRRQFGQEYDLLIAGARIRTEERSEEHTSELQSQSNLVCRLLLEKKKKQIKIHTHHHPH